MSVGSNSEKNRALEIHMVGLVVLQESGAKHFSGVRRIYVALDQDMQFVAVSTYCPTTRIILVNLLQWLPRAISPEAANGFHK